MTSPYRFYQFWINTEDADVGRYLRMFTFLSRAEIEGIERAHRDAPEERFGQHILAKEVTELVHGEEPTSMMSEISRVIFDKKADPTSISDEVFAMLAREIPSVQYAKAAELSVLDVLEGAFALSRSAGRKLVQQGGVTVNGEKLAADALTVPRGKAVRGRWFLVRKGGRDIALADVG
jgi:tyrosyl-tRNA synthetase